MKIKIINIKIRTKNEITGLKPEVHLLTGKEPILTLSDIQSTISKPEPELIRAFDYIFENIKFVT